MKATVKENKSASQWKIWHLRRECTTNDHLLINKLLDQEYKHNHLEHKKRLIKIKKGSVEVLPPIHQNNGRYNENHCSMDFDLFKNSLQRDKKTYNLNKDISGDKSRPIAADHKTRPSVKKSTKNIEKEGKERHQETGGATKGGIQKREKSNEQFKSMPGSLGNEQLSQEISIIKVKENKNIDQKEVEKDVKEEPKILSKEDRKETPEKAVKKEKNDAHKEEVRADEKDVSKEVTKVNKNDFPEQAVKEVKNETPKQDLKEESKEVSKEDIKEINQKDLKEDPKEISKEDLKEAPEILPIEPSNTLTKNE
jgi:hypothetical protein